MKVEDIVYLRYTLSLNEEDNFRKDNACIILDLSGYERLRSSNSFDDRNLYSTIYVKE